MQDKHLRLTLRIRKRRREGDQAQLAQRLPVRTFRVCRPAINYNYDFIVTNSWLSLFEAADSAADYLLIPGQVPRAPLLLLSAVAAFVRG